MTQPAQSERVMDSTQSEHTAESIAEAITPTLDAFVACAPPFLRKVTDDLYEALLNNVQDYVRENGQWNIGEEIRRCRKIEAQNIELRARNYAMLEALKQVNSWLCGVASADMDEVVADGGITAAMVVRKEADWQQKKVRAAITNAVEAEIAS